MRLFFSLMAASVVVGLTGCVGKRNDPVPLPPDVVICPAELPTPKTQSGMEILCPEPETVSGGKIKDAFIGYLSCRAVLNAYAKAWQSCVEVHNERRTK